MAGSPGQSLRTLNLCNIVSHSNEEITRSAAIGCIALVGFYFFGKYLTLLIFLKSES
jgi:hypothetical protein